MKKIEKYYDNTKNLTANYNIKEFIKLNTKVGKAIELGCGAGRDTIYLIKNGWNVLAVDREDVKEIIIKNLNENELKKFKFSKQNFEDIKLEKCDLLVANFSLPFCSKNNFEELWNKITNSISNDGYFVGNFFGINDDWNKTKKEITFFTKNEVLDLFKNFEILIFKEIEKDGTTGLGKTKHWHIFNIIAKK
jgi:SAM-dependent methyltransferase